MSSYRAFALLCLALPTPLACGGRAGSSGFAGNGAGSSSGGVGGSDGGHASGSGGDLDGGVASDAPSLFADRWTATPEAAPPPAQVPVVYAHSADTLYRLDPTSGQVAVVGPFQGCTQVIDIALDQNSHAYVTPVPNPPVGLSFWGAGSTTAAPPTSSDGGGIPIVE